MRPIRAVGLLSGGLDSALAARLLLDQGIEVIALHLESPTACRSDVAQVARELGVRLVTRPKGEEYLRLLRQPRFGYGRNMNPCVDCRVFMFQLGREAMEAWDARFLFTGEVLGQRPMSQSRSGIDVIDRHSGLDGRVLRPLSARLLPETEPERRGWVDRSKLLDLSGRARTTQLRMAEAYGLTAFQSPAGGCLLTDPHFSRRLRDLFDHVAEDETSMDDVALLRLGRHVRLEPRLKVVIGRDQEENQRLASFESEARWSLEAVGFAAPNALVCGARDEPTLERAAGLILSYAKPAPAGALLRWRWDGAEHTRPAAAFDRAPRELPVL
jgi:tRNA U34 2-thiouridine synthase MnmA/TrmU